MITEQQLEQIRSIAQKNSTKLTIQTETQDVYMTQDLRKAFINGATMILDSLDIDDDLFDEILFKLRSQQIGQYEAKQQILNSLKIKE